MGLGVLVHPALMAAVLGRVDSGDERRVEPAREVVARHRHQPVVAVQEVELVAVAELDPGGEHVGVHALHPGDELPEVGGAGRLANPVDGDAPGDLLRRRLLAAPRQDMDVDAELDQRLRELADVASEPPFDQRWVLPGEDQDARHPASALSAHRWGALKAPAGGRG